MDKLLEMIFFETVWYVRFDSGRISAPVGSVGFGRSDGTYGSIRSHVHIGRHGRGTRLDGNAPVLTVGVRTVDVTNA